MGKKLFILLVVLMSLSLIGIIFVQSFFINNSLENEEQNFTLSVKRALSFVSRDIEEFELSVINDERVSLYHLSSETTYEFSGRGFIQFLRNSEKSESSVRNNGRKRTKIIRKVKERRSIQ